MPGVARHRCASASPRRDDTGAAAVEFAIISTVLLTLMFGVLQYGILFFQMFTAQHAAAEAASLARTAVVPDADGVGGACGEWRQAVADSTTLVGADWEALSWRTLDGAPMAIDDRLEVTVTWEPLEIAGGLIPIPWTEPRETTVTTTLSRLGPGPEYAAATPAGLGCPPVP
ncbi:MAG: TadE family protein [Kineosporiaceae bacterium]